MTMTQLQAADLELSAYIRPGDMVWWPIGTGEPRTLTEALVSQRHEFGGRIRVFAGASFSGTLLPEHADVFDMVSFGAIGTNRALAAAEVLDILPVHISHIADLIESGTLPVDVAMLHLASPIAGSPSYSAGVICDYVQLLAQKARIVIAEVNDQMPFTHGDTSIMPSEIDVAIHTSRPLVELQRQKPGVIEQQIGDHVAELIPDGACLQLGYGKIPEGVLANLDGRSGLGVHTGALGDGIVELIQRGVVTNEHKAVDTGLSVAGSLYGTRRLFEFCNNNPQIQLRPLQYTHSMEVMASIDKFISINGALQVDLSGQANAEYAQGRYLGAVGGQVEFVRGARASRGGRSIIALPSTAQNGGLSTIVNALDGGVVTTPRSDIDTVVTEFGVAEIRDVSLRERAARLKAIAHPDFREQLG